MSSVLAKVRRHEAHELVVPPPDIFAKGADGQFYRGVVVRVVTPPAPSINDLRFGVCARKLPRGNFLVSPDGGGSFRLWRKRAPPPLLTAPPVARGKLCGAAFSAVGKLSYLSALPLHCIAVNYILGLRYVI